VKSSRRLPQSSRRVGQQTRLRIASEAARILAEEGVVDYQLAKRKAAERLGMDGRTNLPTNEEIEHALREHLLLFQRQKLAQRVADHRRVASDAMKFLDAYQPRAVGTVLSGTITEYNDIQIHVCADTPEQIAVALMEHEIPYEQKHRRFRYGGDRYQETPVYRFTAENINIELAIFSPTEFREPPLSPINGKPMKRASRKQLLPQQ
jgi:acylphosphatase